MVSKSIKRFDNGGVVGNSNYSFDQGQMSSAEPSTGMGSNSPLVQVNTPAAQTEESTDFLKPFGMKKGGKVATRRGDGIAQRGRTRERMV
jgi:hypothetical protein